MKGAPHGGLLVLIWVLFASQLCSVVVVARQGQTVVLKTTNLQEVWVDSSSSCVSECGTSVADEALFGFNRGDIKRSTYFEV
ncbi:hypothetical protein QOT17_007211 [Balamuthia mandrillaris]